MADEVNAPAEEEDDEFGIDQKRMPFTDHLAELRNRLVVCVITVLASFLLFFFVFGRQIFDVMMVPLVWACRSVGEDPAKIKVARTPVSMFLTSAGVSLIAAVGVAVPVTLYELWMFVAPGLKKKERRVILPVLTFGTVFFALGALFAYSVVLRFVLRFLLKYTLNYKVAALWNVGAIVKFEAILMLVFGLAFEMPLVIVGMTRVGLVSPKTLAKKRKYIIVLMFVVGALSDDRPLRDKHPGRTVPSRAALPLGGVGRHDGRRAEEAICAAGARHSNHRPRRRDDRGLCRRTGARLLPGRGLSRRTDLRRGRRAPLGAR